jgi:hypothetical protein
MAGAVGATVGTAAAVDVPVGVTAGVPSSAAETPGTIKEPADSVRGLHADSPTHRTKTITAIFFFIVSSPRDLTCALVGGFQVDNAAAIGGCSNNHLATSDILNRNVYHLRQSASILKGVEAQVDRGDLIGLLDQSPNTPNQQGDYDKQNHPVAPGKSHYGRCCANGLLTGRGVLHGAVPARAKRVFETLPIKPSPHQKAADEEAYNYTS